MSYALAGPLQAAIYDALSGDPVLAGIVGSAIYDAVPQGNVPDLHVLLGVEDVKDASDCTSAGAEHFVSVSVVTTKPGFAEAKAAAGAVSDVLHDAALVLSRGRLISLWFEKAQARRGEGQSTRVVDLRFRARVSDE